MKLKITCPVCKKEVRGIQAEFPAFGKMNYVYNCGHIELREIIEFNQLEEDLKIDKKVNALCDALEASIEIVKEDKKAEIFIDTSKELIAAQLREKEFQELKFEHFSKQRLEWESPLYEKQLFEQETRNKIPALYWSAQVVPEYFCEECQEKHTKMHLYKFQREGVKFAGESNFRCLIADEMGLGKTPQAIVSLKSCESKLLPTIIIVKGATQFQWVSEIIRWSFPEFGDVMPITKREQIIPGFKCYVISMDLLSERERKVKSKKDAKQKTVLELLVALRPKAVILDEVQSFKDAGSSRTGALIKLLQETQVEHIIQLSGTPIKNYASEYFVPLNILAPAHFNSLSHFKFQWLSQDSHGKYTHIKPHLEQRFKEVTSRWIIRRESKDVQKDLPELRINYQLVEIDDPVLKSSYNFQLGLFNNWLQNKAQVDSAGILGWLAKLRAITGQAKCKHAVEFVSDFIESNSNDLISVGIHHNAVRDTLKYVFKAKGFDPLSLSGEDSNEDKWKIASAFNAGKSRILIINMIAGGVGLNLQGCNNFLALERAWNGADEDQFHKRFHRHGQKKRVWGTYIMAKGTIDEFYHDMVFVKRKNISSAGVGAAPSLDMNLSSLLEFSEIVVSNKIK
jgi:SWI/SNF-related matrix-associated actin-dependent regulator of chromatin subfamily A-like protein 1